MERSRDGQVSRGRNGLRNEGQETLVKDLGDLNSNLQVLKESLKGMGRHLRALQNAG